MTCQTDKDKRRVIEYQHDSLQYPKPLQGIWGTPRCQYRTKYKNLTVVNNVLKDKIVHEP